MKMAQKVLHKYKSKNEGKGLTTFRVEYDLWDEIPPAERESVRSRIKKVGDNFFYKKGFQKNGSSPSFDFSRKEVRHYDYIKREKEDIYLFVGNGLLNRMRLKLNVEARVLSPANQEEMFNWRELRDYLLDIH